jgi:Sulfite exporter TauE/SafE
VTLKQHVDRKVFWRFGVFSAAGGLVGAVLNARIQSRVLTLVFGALLIFAGISGLNGLAEKMRFGRKAAWIAGGISGFFGGLVGNQGGIRSAALLGFDISKEAFVATATAVALIVDGARMPVYFMTDPRGRNRACLDPNCRWNRRRAGGHILGRQIAAPDPRANLSAAGVGDNCDLGCLHAGSRPDGVRMLQRWLRTKSYQEPYFIRFLDSCSLIPWVARLWRSNSEPKSSVRKLYLHQAAE